MYIARAINSCLNQTLDERDYEIIVIDDASIDDSWNTITKFTGLIKYTRHKENLGVASASNTGLKLARGEYYVRVDGDDFVNRNFLKTLKEVLDYNDDIGYVYCDHFIVYENYERKNKMNSLDILLDHGAGVMFRKRNLLSIGGYNEKYKTREDYDLILRYSEKFDGYHLRLPYYRYFKRSNSLSSNLEERKQEKIQINKEKK